MTVQQSGNKGNQAPQAPQTQMGAKLAGAQNNQPSQGFQPQNNTAFQSTQDDNQSFSFSNMGGDIDKPMPLSASGEALSKAQKAFQTVLDAYKDGTSKIVTTLLAIDHTDSALNLPVSYLIVATQQRTNLAAGVGYQAVIIEASAEFNAESEIFLQGAPGNKVTVMKFVSDADTDEARNKLAQFVASSFNTDKVFAALAYTMPKLFTETHLDDPAMVKSLVARTTFQASIALHEGAGGNNNLPLAAFAKGPETLSAQLAFGAQQQMSLLGLPIRADFTINLNSEPKDKTNSNALGSSRTATIAQVAAYPDIIYQPLLDVPKPLFPGAQVFQNQQQSADVYRKYIPRVNLTNLISPRLTTKQGQILALAAAFASQQGDAWMGAYLPRRDVDKNDVDLHDVGVLNIEANLNGDPAQPGPFIDTKADGFTTADMFTYLRGIFRQGVVYSMDISERSIDTSYNGWLAAVDVGDPDQYASAIATLNEMTGGKFGNHFPLGTPITLRMNERQHMGYWRDVNKNLRDLRDLDYLAMSNLYLAKKPEMVRDFSDTYVRTDYPEAQRLAARVAIYRQVAPNVVFTGMARRVTFNPVFITAILNSFAECGIQMPLVAPYMDTATNDRAVGNFGAALNNNGQASLFTRNVSTPGFTAPAVNSTQFSTNTAWNR